MRRLLPLLALPLLVAGCSTRERANPFDPNNPATNGRPSGFVAIAGEGQVQLRWQQVAGNTLTGYQLFRRGPGEAAFRAITPVLNTGVTQFRDVGLLDGQDYTYRLYFVFTGGLGSRPAEDTATPGSAIPWMILSSGSDAFQITPDGRRIANDVTGFTGTIDVAVNAQSGLVWISDPGASRVVALNPTTGVRTAIPVAEPGSIAVDSFDGNAWVCDPTAGLVHHFRPQGDPASLDIASLDTPNDVAVDAVDGSVWVSERGANRVSRYPEFDQNPILRRTVPAPSRVAVDSVTRVAWITSYTRGTVTRVDLGGVVLDTLDLFVTPLGIAADARRGRVWVADPGAGEIVALRRDGTVELRLTGFPDAGELSVDARSGEVWAVLGNSGEVVRVAPNGAVLRRLDGFTFPFAIAVDPGGAR